MLFAAELQGTGVYFLSSGQGLIKPSQLSIRERKIAQRDENAVLVCAKRGECRDGSCTLLSEKTHVYDVANRPWLLPFIYHEAKDPTTKTFLRMLIRAANQTRPEDRPSFGELVHRVNAFGRFDAETYAAVAEAEAEDDGDSLVDAAAVASSRRGSGQQHHQCRGRRCRRRQKKKHESGA